ncbi:MAG: hypothetical protein Q7U13_14625, partial [Rhodoferax sp.]|nr:hypothetical protein [Rhodoferax sp.]
DAGSLCMLETEDLLTIGQGASVQVKKAAEYLGIDLSGVDDLAAPPAIAPAAPLVMGRMSTALESSAMHDT